MSSEDARPRDEAGHKPTLYLAGPVAHVDDHGVGWRETVAETAHSFETANPLDKYNVGLDDLAIVHDGESGDGEVTPAEIVTNDKRLIDESDAILVGYEAVRMTGTPMEVQYAFGTPKPVVLWIRDDTDLEALSPWWHHHVSAIEESLTSALWQLRQRTGVSTQ